MTGPGGTGRGKAGQRDAATGNKSVIFHLIYKQVVMLRWAIAYYGFGPTSDISKQSSPALRWTNEECVSLADVSCWESGLARPMVTQVDSVCYCWAWEQTQV